MELTISEDELTHAVDEVMAKHGYVPIEQLVGKTISIQEFAQKYAKPHGTAWVKRNILYPFHSPISFLIKSRPCFMIA